MVYATLAQPAAFKTRVLEGGLLESFPAGRRGRTLSSPLQLGHTPPRTPSLQETQNVHSNEQIRASSDPGGKSMSQHSQLGRSSSICVSLYFRPSYELANPFIAPDRALQPKSCSISSPVTDDHRAMPDCAGQRWQGLSRDAFREKMRQDLFLQRF